MNIASIPHDPTESDSIPIENDLIPPAILELKFPQELPGTS